MLDNITKRRIDDCRDILVGKLPDPKSQIEQITIALIYKFMDDMDKEAIELGGKAKFFSDYTLPDPSNPEKQITVPFEKYSWDNLFDTRVSASEMLKLYSEAIEGMVKNPNIPDLFANIFKNAYLPYRDPETLKMFLKTISEFEYTHSEKLGDAFEYLLSVMGSQGDAGQFRTPRHIIDFLVSAVNPGKNDTILDPACGTAGFLISAFKHIKEQNNNTLTPDEQKKLIKNFVGYDISPDMVRLSLVNLYLHGFSDPHIFEYDSLSSEQRWDETFDVVLANPPFMSPKGGIRPHKKFTISSNRSEVLFVDYIAEHLNPKGRAGIIVPEGIIFQNGTAYKALRKMLVDKYLYAVVSLPAGVFNPYSGVKTSILLMDADLAKKTNDVLFIKIDNDGFGLGTQRNAVKGGQLEEAVQILKTFRENCFESKAFENTSLAHAVNKVEIGKSGDYNLSGETYKIFEHLDSLFPIKKIGEICIINPLKSELTDVPIDTMVSFVPMADLNENKIDFEPKQSKILKDVYSGYTYFKNNDVLIAKVTPCFENGKGGLAKNLLNEIGFGSSEFYVLRSKDSIILPNFLYRILNSNNFRDYAYPKMIGTGGLRRIPKNVIAEYKIPLPSLSVQQQIVAEIESYQKIIDGAKMVVDNYKPRIEIDTNWQMVQLGEIGKVRMCKRIFKEETTVEGDVPFYKIGTFGKEPDAFIKTELFTEYQNKFSYPKKGEVLISTSGTIGRTVVFDGRPAYFQDSNIVWISNDESMVLNSFLNVYYQQIIWKPAEGVTIARLYNKIIEETKIPMPTKEIQQQIVFQIEKEQALVNANKELITIYKQKIKERIGKVWGEKEQKTISKKISNDLYLAMMLKQMERKIQLNYGEVATQKTVFHLNTFTNQKLDYPFMNSNYGTYSYQLKDDLLKNPYLIKTKKGNGEVFVVSSSKENEVLEALSNPDNKDFVNAINEVLNIYQSPLINKETEYIELLNTVSKVILDKQMTDLEVVYKEMENWEINQNGFKTKADKFTKAKTKKMIGLIEKLGLMEKLIR